MLTNGKCSPNYVTIVLVNLHDNSFGNQFQFIYITSKPSPIMADRLGIGITLVVLFVMVAITHAKATGINIGF